MAQKNKNSRKKSKEKELPSIVGIGASAGGLNALKEFFSHVPENTGLAFVVVVHLSPKHKSMLAELLQPHIKIPVQQVTETMEMKPNHVYIIPPNAHLNSIDTHLRLTKLEEKRSERAPIDHFFRTLAKTHDGNAIGVILTGTGSDGTIGLKEIKDKGGFTIVQDPGEAEYADMPRNAISTGIVDVVLRIKDIVEAIMGFVSTSPSIKSLETLKNLQKPVKYEQDLVSKIFSLIKAHTGRDFSHYKLSTILRRMQRRMQIQNLEKLEDYLEFLRKNAEEVIALADDFLVNVTNFFRDPDAFQNLEKNVIPDLYKNRNQSDSIRIWSVGCASGEEAYSLGILMMEEASHHENAPDFQIFASDLHEPSLKKGREGYYPGDVQNDIPEERIQRFFTRQNGTYQIRKDLREKVLFTTHNLLKDPPFSKIDLLVCRNLLIYLKKDVQKSLFELFHYALSEKGYLMMGPSENYAPGELFTISSKEFSIYIKKKVPALEVKLPVFPKSKDILTYNKPEEKREPVVHFGKMHQQVVEKYAPPSILVSSDYQVLHISRQAGNYLHISGGEISKDLFKLIREELQLELRSVLITSRDKKKNIRSKPIDFNSNGQKSKVIFSATEVEDPELGNLYLIIFEEYDDKDLLQPVNDANEKDYYENKRIKDLETELEENKQRLQMIVEEYETSQEEMKAANEELQSANEELRSTMEELETNKEELQSMNEELTTVNQENRHKVEELAQLSDDLQNLLAATDIATLFLNKNLYIMRFTPKLGEIFNIRLADRGRPITDLTHKLGNYDDLVSDAHKVLKTLQPVEKEVQDFNENTYIARMFPYRSSDDKIDGVVITFIDISSRKMAEEQLKASKIYAESIIETLHEPLLVLNPDLIVKSANRSFYEHFEVQPETTVGRLIYELGNGQWNIPALRKLLNEVLPENNVFKDFEVEHTFETIGKKVMLLNARRLDSVQLILLGIRDITIRKENEEQLKDSRNKLQKAKEEAEDAARAKEQFLAHMSHEIRTPLNAVLGLTNLLLKEGKAQKRAENIKALKYSAENLHHLINDILDLSKIEAGKISYHPEPVNLTDLLENLLKAHQPVAKEKGIKLILNRDENIPEVIISDHLKLNQVLMNLLNNAIKFTSAGKVSLDIKLLRKEDDLFWIEFNIIDTGIGIPEEKLDEIFDTFSQGDISTSRKYGGSGLGLTLCRLYLQMMESTIQVESKPQTGSRFYFLLKVLQGMENFTDEMVQTDEEISENLKNNNILLVEDDDINRMVISQFLNDWWKLKFKEARNGVEALELVKKHRFDLILMDLRMPFMDGFEAAEKIRNLPDYEDVKIIALTADISKQVKDKVNSGLFNEILIKPVNPDLMLNKLNKLNIRAKAVTENKDAKGETSVSSRDRVDLSYLRKTMNNRLSSVKSFLQKSYTNLESMKERYREAMDKKDSKELDDLHHKYTTLLRIYQADELNDHFSATRKMLMNNPSDEKINELKEKGINLIDELWQKLKNTENELE